MSSHWLSSRQNSSVVIWISLLPFNPALLPTMKYGKWLCGYLWVKSWMGMLSSIFLRHTSKWPLRNLICTLTFLWEVKIPSHPISFSFSVAFVAVFLSAHLAVDDPALSVPFPFLLYLYSGELKWLHLHVACDLIYNHGFESYKCFSPT